VIIANASEGRRRSAEVIVAEALEELERRSKDMLAGPALIVVQTPAVESP
jgi:hypothetical protein